MISMPPSQVMLIEEEPKMPCSPVFPFHAEVADGVVLWGHHFTTVAGAAQVLVAKAADLPLLLACEPEGWNPALIWSLGGLVAAILGASVGVWRLGAQRCRSSIASCTTACTTCLTRCVLRMRSAAAVAWARAPSIHVTSSPVDGSRSLLFKDCGELGVHMRLAFASLLLIVAGLVWLY